MKITEDILSEISEGKGDWILRGANSWSCYAPAPSPEWRIDKYQDEYVITRIVGNWHLFREGIFDPRDLVECARAMDDAQAAIFARLKIVSCDD